MPFQNVVRAARLDASVYPELKNRPTAIAEAFGVVSLVGAVNIIGKVLGAEMGNLALFIIAGVVGGIGSLVAWAIGTIVIWWVGTTLLRGRATYGQLLRCTGFTYAPMALSLFFFIPAFGVLLFFAGSIWSFMALVLAIREVLGVTSGRAVVLALTAALVILVLQFVIGFGAGLTGAG